MLMQQTKQKVQDRQSKRAAEKKNKTTMLQSKAGEGFEMGEGGFSLGDQINKETLSMALLSEGFMQAYIDFFYLTENTTPRFIEPKPQYLKEYSLR